MSAPTDTSGTTAQVSHQAASSTTSAKAMLETSTSANVVNSNPVLALLGRSVDAHHDRHGDMGRQGGGREGDGPGSPAARADGDRRAVPDDRLQQRPVDRGGDRCRQGAGGDVEPELQRRLAPHHPECEGFADDAAQHEHQGRGDDEPEEQGHLGQDEELGVAAVVNRDRSQYRGGEDEEEQCRNLRLVAQPVNGRKARHRAPDDERGRAGGEKAGERYDS